MQRSRAAARATTRSTAARRPAGKRPANAIWLWGQGKAPRLRPFARVYGKRGRHHQRRRPGPRRRRAAGWDRIDVPGATGYLDTDYAAKGRYGDRGAEGPRPRLRPRRGPRRGVARRPGRRQGGGAGADRPRHRRPAAGGAAGSRRLADPGLARPPHAAADAGPRYGAVPFAIAGTGVSAKGQAAYDEAVAAASDVSFDPGHELMQWFLS